MAETVIVLVIGGIALALSARWIYRTIAGKSEGCGCADSSCQEIASSDTAGNKEG